MIVRVEPKEMLSEASAKSKVGLGFAMFPFSLDLARKPLKRVLECVVPGFAWCG